MSKLCQHKSYRLPLLLIHTSHQQHRLHVGTAILLDGLIAYSGSMQ